MTLPRLVLAWLPVALWFVIATSAIVSLVAAVATPPAAPRVSPVGPGCSLRALLQWRLIEAAVLTLFASLWFDSLGSGGAWLLFLLVGVLVVVPEWRPSFRVPELPRRALLVGMGADLARYVIAGAILAWRLG
ncbi:MAG TPA: hypothetical protein VEU55_10615 [Gemmatimonadales bacterium]|nr:hypothetical protein [Gemmatimonadales bacterium]